MNTSMPGCACSTQTFGDVRVFHPHCHIIITDGTCDEQGNVQITPYDDAHALEHLFRHKVVKMLLDKGEPSARGTVIVSCRGITAVSPSMSVTR